MEELMQYVWQYRLWPSIDMRTTDGRRIVVLDPGTLNRDAGPDFFNAKILIDGLTWTGNIEIHIRASDWKRHGHDRDKAYDSVILHVVQYNDDQIMRPKGDPIPQMLMTCARDFAIRYHEMVSDPVRELPCGNEIGSFNPLHLHDALTALGFERLYEKSERVLDILKRHNGNWSETIYITLARALGFNTNAEPFELLARTTPLKHLLRHSDSILTIEAILFGQAGLLKDQQDTSEHYIRRLIEEYDFMSVKFGLKPSDNIIWKFARMRPQNSPHRRIAALSSIIYGGFGLASQLLSIETEEEGRQLFNIDLHGYWARHFNFSSETTSTVKALSQTSITILLINVVIPILHAYSCATGDVNRQEKVVDLLSSLKPENNSIVQIFNRAGIEAPNAFITQALIQLRKQYCMQRKCLFCRIGHRLLSSKVKASL